MAICRRCGEQYSRWTTPVSARGVCGECLEAELNGIELPRPQGAAAARANLASSGPRMRWSSFVPRSRSKAVFALAMACYCIGISYFIIGWAGVARVENPPPAFYSIVEDPVGDVLVLVVLAPILESLLLIGVFELVRRARAPQPVQVLTAAIVISVGHVWPWWPHAFIVLPGFCIQSASYAYWRHRGSFKDAFWVVAGIHALINAIPALSTIAYATRAA